MSDASLRHDLSGFALEVVTDGRCNEQVNEVAFKVFRFRRLMSG